VSAKKIGLQKIVPRNISAITAEEFLKEFSEGDYFFNSLGNCGYIRSLSDDRKHITFSKNITLIPNSPISLSKQSEFYRLERGDRVMLFCIGDGTGINIFIHAKK